MENKEQQLDHDLSDYREGEDCCEPKLKHGYLQRFVPHHLASPPNDEFAAHLEKGYKVSFGGWPEPNHFHTPCSTLGRVL
jgi:hypothetical protein